MTEYTVSGLRHQYSESLSFEERTLMAERYLAQLEKGHPAILVAEPDNPVDPKAIAVYIDYECRGHINKEETDDVRPLLDEKGQCDCVVERTDGHITYFVTVPESSEKTRPRVPRRRILPESPLGEQVRMPFTKSENALQLIASRLVQMEVDNDNLSDFIRLAERYVPLMMLSICHDDAFWMNRIGKKLHQLVAKEKDLGLPPEEEARLEDIYKKVYDASRNMHRKSEHLPERVFAAQLDRLRDDATVNSYLYKKYCDAFLDGKGFDEAEETKMAAEHERLCRWLGALEWSEMRSPRNLMAMGDKVNYLGLSRQELYELYSVLLLIEKLEASMKTKTTEARAQNKTDIPEELAALPQWEKAKQAGWVDENGQPTLSRTEAALLADHLARILGINNKWKYFEKLWHRNNMHGDYNTALNQRKSLTFQDNMRKLLG